MSTTGTHEGPATPSLGYCNARDSPSNRPGFPVQWPRPANADEQTHRGTPAQGLVHPGASARGRHGSPHPSHEDQSSWSISNESCKENTKNSNKHSVLSAQSDCERLDGLPSRSTLIPNVRSTIDTGPNRSLPRSERLRTDPKPSPPPVPRHRTSRTSLGAPHDRRFHGSAGPYWATMAAPPRRNGRVPKTSTRARASTEREPDRS